MATGIHLNKSIWSSPLVGYKTEGLWTYIGRNVAGYAIRSSVAITKLLLHYNIQKRKMNNKTKERCDFLKNIL